MDSRSPNWTPVEDKIFENALLRYGGDTPHRWQLIAWELPGKSAEDVYVHYQKLVHDVYAIDSGAVDPPEYDDDGDGLGLGVGVGIGVSKRGEGRKRGMPWTEDEHRRFLDGLDKYGKGDWRMISRMAVVTRTPTQVASHAQKYFLRQQNASNREAKRKSIHDITHSKA